MYLFMKLIFIFLVFLTTSCASKKYSLNYFQKCEKEFNKFSELSSCALESIKKDCVDESKCLMKDERFLEIVKTLKLMVEQNEITENEAMYRYLNLIEIEQSKSKLTYRNNLNYGYYPGNFNYNYSRNLLPFYFRNGYFY